MHIEITRDALKKLHKLDKPVRRRLQAAIDRLADEPRPAGVVVMQSLPAGHFRLRVGDWRIIYHVVDDRLIIVVIDIGHRREIYRR